MATIDMIDTGYFYADGGAMFGAIPKTAWHRKYPSDENNGCILAMRSLLITTANQRRILIDTGAGFKHLRSLSYYRFFGLHNLEDELSTRNLRPDDITDVILTHLHFDHCGFCTQEENGKVRMTFPKARHWVSLRQWHNLLHPNALEKESYFKKDMQAVEESGQLQLLSEDLILTPDVTLRLFDGHTAGQIVPYIRTASETVVFAGDVIPLFASISPEWISAYDIMPLTSYEGKCRLLEQAVREQQRIVFCHDAYTASTRIKKTESGLYLPIRESIQKAVIQASAD